MAEQLVNYQKQMLEAYQSGRQRGLSRRKKQIKEYATEDVPTEDTFATRKKLNVKKYADTLATDPYFMEEGMKMQSDMAELQSKQQEVENQRQLLQLKATKRAMLIAREDKDAGVKFAQEAGLDVESLNIDKEGNFITTDDKGQKTTTNYDDIIEAIASANTIFSAQSALTLSDRRKRNKASLKANEYLKPDGNIININGIKTAYRMKYDLMDELELLMLKNSDPEQWKIETAKIKSAPEFTEWTLDYMGIDIMGTGTKPDVPAKVLAALRKKYKDVPVEDLKKAYLAKQRKLQENK